MKLFQRLNLRPSFADYSGDLEGVAIAKNVNPNADEYDRAWKKFKLPSRRHFLSIACYYSDEHALVKEHASQCIPELEEFFFGDWRNTFQTPEKTIDPGWWKRRFIWMQLFEAAALWGSVLGRWDFLQRVGTFPEPDSCISDGYRAVDRDLYVAWAAFLRGAAPTEIEPLLEQAQPKLARISSIPSL